MTSQPGTTADPGACPATEPVALVLSRQVRPAHERVLRGLREGGSPWLLRAGDRSVVLRGAGPLSRLS